MSARDDQADIESVLAGNLDAFENIVRRWQGPIVNLAYRFCHDRARAEEMAQEAFLRTYRALAQWRKDSVFSTWLFAVATNLFRTEIRRIPPRSVALDEVAEPRDTRAIDGGLEERDRARVVRRAVEMLPAKYREVMILFYFHGLDTAAAAQSLRLSEGTVKARLSRGRDMLRTRLTRVMLPHPAREFL